MLSAEELGRIGHEFHTAFDAGDISALRSMYRDDATLISPTPPRVSPEFSTRVEGRDQIMRCFEMIFAGNPGEFTPLEILTGVDTVVVIWKLGAFVGVDTLLLDNDGVIVSHYDIIPTRSTIGLLNESC